MNQYVGQKRHQYRPLLFTYIMFKMTKQELPKKVLHWFIAAYVSFVSVFYTLTLTNSTDFFTRHVAFAPMELKLE